MQLVHCYDTVLVLRCVALRNGRLARCIVLIVLHCQVHNMTQD